MTNQVLTLNAGSSGIKFGVYEIAPEPRVLCHGELTGIATPESRITIIRPPGDMTTVSDVLTTGFNDAAVRLLDFLQHDPVLTSLRFISHRIVQGRGHAGPVRIDAATLTEFRAASAVDPEHMPLEITLIEECQRRFPQVAQIACFDSSWFHALPVMATIIPIPRAYRAAGIRRYGFHGLSYAYVQQEHARLDPHASQKKVIIAHLGSGASLSAISNGLPVETSMGFSPASGIPMGTRTGDLDPAVAWYLIEVNKMTPPSFNRMINHESGLLGISEISSSMKDLMLYREFDPRAEEAVQFFCYQVRKWIGSFAAVLGGLDTLIFTGGIGEHDATVREMICGGLGFLGIDVEHARNQAGALVISPQTGRVCVRVIPTNEEVMLAKAVNQFINT